MEIKKKERIEMPIILIVVILMVILNILMIKSGTKKIGKAREINEAVRADMQRRKEYNLTKDECKQIKKINIERHKNGIPELGWEQALIELRLEREFGNK